MFLWKRILVLVVMAPFVYFIVSRYFPEEGSRHFWTHDQVRNLSVKLQKVAHHLADVFCSLPEECKKAADAFFEFVYDILDVWETAVSIYRNVTASSAQKTHATHDDETIHKQRMAKINASTYRWKGTQFNEEEVTRPLRFERYEQTNLCRRIEGMSDNEFATIAEAIAILTNGSVKLKEISKDTLNVSTEVNVTVLGSSLCKLYFWHVAVGRNGDKVDMSYSLHFLEYDLKTEQRKPENAANLKFSESLNDGDDNDEEDDDYLAAHFLACAFYRNRTIDRFVKPCNWVYE